VIQSIVETLTVVDILIELEGRRSGEQVGSERR